MSPCAHGKNVASPRRPNTSALVVAITTSTARTARTAQTRTPLRTLTVFSSIPFLRLWASALRAATKSQDVGPRREIEVGGIFFMYGPQMMTSIGGVREEDVVEVCEGQRGNGR